jgi:hypothetical protein
VRKTYEWKSERKVKRGNERGYEPLNRIGGGITTGMGVGSLIIAIFMFHQGIK